MPARKPIALLKQQGTYNVTRHRKRQHEPLTGGELGAPPEWLTRRQKTLWRNTAKAAATMGIFTAIDQTVFTDFVLLADLQRTAAETSNAGLLLRVAPDLRRVCSELGFTPVGRTRLGRADPYPAAEGPERWGELKVVGGKR